MCLSVALLRNVCVALTGSVCRMQQLEQWQVYTPLAYRILVDVERRAQQLSYRLEAQTCLTRQHG